MTRETLFAAIGQVDDALLEQAEQGQKTPVSTHLRRWAALAAALCLVVGLGAFGLSQIRVGSSAPGSSDTASPAADVGSFDSYPGPILPLTADADTGLTAQRALTLDYAPRARTANMATVTDRYTLTNPTDADQTLLLRYPVAASLSDLYFHPVALTVDGAALEPSLAFGPVLYDGQTREDYLALLSGTDFLEDDPDLSQTVTLWRFTHTDYAPTDGVAPSVAITFHLPPGARVQCFGMNSYGCSPAGDGGYDWEFGYFVESAAPLTLLFYGEAPGDYTVQGYSNLGFDAGTEIDVSAQITVETAPLGEVLSEAVALAVSRGIEGDISPDDPAVHALWQAVGYDLLAWRVDPEDLENVSLDEMIDRNWLMRRVSLLSFPVTVPAGGSAEVQAVYDKEACYNREHSTYRELYGFDWVTSSDALPVTDFSLRVAATEPDAMEIVRRTDDPDAPWGEVVFRLLG
ncbi:MAG: hypothetical protein IJ751_05630 [Oscillospiraceae bacterium]|nr:hypothetical protein [Oscillospiraceae bacterium]